MTIKFPIFLLVLITISCQDNSSNQSATDIKDTTITKILIEKQADTIVGKSAKGNNKLLALSTNALVLVDKTSGSTNEILFGMEMNQLVDIINTTLQSKVKSIQINTECGVGPLNFAVWSNGLSIPFQENKMKSTVTKKHWEFAGWYISNDSTNTPALKTMSNIGIGSTKSALESSYVVSYQNSSIGYEFSTTAGLYGLLSGNHNDAVIKAMWSGVSCIFR